MNTSTISLHTAAIILTGFFLVLQGCSDHPKLFSDLQETLTFYASFDYGFDADVALGDPPILHSTFMVEQK